MAIQVFNNATLLIGTAWTGTAPGTASTPSGTINSGSGTYIDATGYLQSASVDFSAALQDGTTFGSGGFVTQYAGLKSGKYDLTFFGDYATTLLIDKLNTMGIGSTIYLDLKPTSSARGVSNPSYVGAVILSDLNFFNAQVGNLSTVSVSWSTTGAFATLTA